MTEFKVGDRVRILDLPTTVAYAGRVGAVVLVKRYGNQAVFSYHVLLDAEPATSRPFAYVPFRPDDLEPEASGTP
jgi:hypothetical protein